MNFLDYILENEIDQSLPGFFSGSIKKGYNLSNELIKREDELQLPEAENIYGYLRHFYIDILLKRETKNSNIDLKIKSNSVVPNGYTYFTFNYGKYVFTVNKTTRKSGFPRDAKNRTYRCSINEDISANQMSLFEQPSDKIVPIDSGKTYLMVTYGGTGFNLDYVEIGLPDADAKKWLFQKDITNALSIVQPASDLER